MIFATGDIHGEHDIQKLSGKNWPEGKKLHKSDFLLIAGDFGLVWYPPAHPRATEQQYWLKWLSEKPWTTLFVDGNHENFDLLDRYDIGQKWGGKVSKIAESVFRLHRGQTFDIDGKKLWSFGGGYSYDKAIRTPGLSWWPQEIPNYREMTEGMQTLEKIDYAVDLVLTHTAPSTVAALALCQVPSKCDEPHNGGERGLRDYFETIATRLKLNDKWIFGHFHIDQSFGKYRAIYSDIIRLC